MKKIYYGNIQRQVTSLIPIIELYITLIKEIEQTKNKLNILPVELKSLKKQADLLNLKSAHKSADDLQPELEQTEFKLDSLVDDLDEVFINLVTFECKLKNIIALRERLEAIQEERINGLTPERIYKLLEKQKQRSEAMPSSLSSEDNNLIKQKLINFGNKLRDYHKDTLRKWLCHAFGDYPKGTLRDRKTAVSLAIIASLSLGWIAGYHSSTNVTLNDNETVETTQERN
ncbi:MAG: hypothetical protein ACRC80_19100 [Waterburya sp.]